MAGRHWWQFWRGGRSRSEVPNACPACGRPARPKEFKASFWCVECRKTVATSDKTVSGFIRSEIKYAVTSGGVDALRRLIERCKEYDDGILALKEARRQCPSSWQAFREVLDDAIKDWAQLPLHGSTGKTAATESSGPIGDSLVPGDPVQRDRWARIEAQMRITLNRLQNYGVYEDQVVRIMSEMRELQSIFFNHVFGGDLDAEMEYFPKDIYTRRELIIFGKIAAQSHRLREAAKGLPDIVMRDGALDPEKYHYWWISKNLIKLHGDLVWVSYLSHFPKFEINFKYRDGKLVYSGERTGTYDVNFLTLGYHGEGPRYARVFLDAAGFRLTPEELASIMPGDVIERSSGAATIVRGADKLRTWPIYSRR